MGDPPFFFLCCHCLPPCLADTRPFGMVGICDRGPVVVGYRCLLVPGNLISGDADTLSANCDVPVRDHLACLFRRPGETLAVDNGLKAAFELVLDLQRENIVDIGIGTKQAEALEDRVAALEARLAALEAGTESSGET